MSDVNSVYAKIHTIMKEVTYLKEDGEIKFKDGGKGFAIISEEKVFRIIRSKMVEHRLILIPVKMQQKTIPIGPVHSEKGELILGKTLLSEVESQFHIIDVETGDFAEIACSGAGEDPLDKGIAKAITRLYKSLMLKLFIIPTGKDPDLFENNPDFNSPPMQENQTLGEIEKSSGLNPAGAQDKPESKPEPKKPKLTMELVGEVLTEYMFNLNMNDMSIVKKDILAPCGDSALSKIKSEKYPQIIDLVDTAYINTGVTFKTPKLLIAKSAL